MSKIVRSISAALLCTLFATEPLQAATGDWDLSFGQDGRLPLVIPGIPVSVRSWEMQPDGKTVIAGHLMNGSNELPGYLIARFNANGTPDSSFDGDGVRYLGLNSNVDPIEIELQPDGEIVIAAPVFTSDDDYVQLLRLNTDGSPDASFGTSGELALNDGLSGGDPHIALAADGSIFVVSGSFDSASSATISVVTHVTASGTVDSSYGTNGAVVINSPEGFLQSTSIAALPNGAVALGGRVLVGSDTVPFVALVTPQGQPDAAFGDDGIVEVPFFHGVGGINGVSATPEGKIVVVGERSDLVGIRHFIARFNPNGTLDATFGSGGRIVTVGQLAAVAVESDGKIVVAGTVNEVGLGLGLLSRYNSDGSPDLMFARRGHSRFDFSLGDFASRVVARDFEKHADGSYSAFVSVVSGVNPSSNNTVRLLATGPSAGAIGLSSVSEFAGQVPTSEATPAGPLINVYRTGGSDGIATIKYRLVSLSAAAGTDFVASSATLTFNDGEIGPKPIDVQIINDELRENSEIFLVELFGPTGAVLTRERVLIGIGPDQDAGSELAFGYSYEQAIEGAGAVTLVVQRMGDLSEPLTVSYTPNAGTASAGTDFNAAAGTISWAANEGGVRELSIPVIDDAVTESNEQFTVALSIAGSSYPHGTATISIVDDDDAAAQARFGFATSSFVVTEGASNAMLEVRRIGDLSQAVSALYQSSGATATDGQDYTGVSGALNWGAGDGTSRTIMVPLLNDATRESIEQIIVTLSAAAPASTIAGGSAIVYILDDEPVAPRVTVNLGAGGSIAESTGTLQVPVTLASTPADALSVTYSVSTETSDVAFATGTLSWTAGDASQRTISIPISNDVLDEVDETFSVRLSNPQGVATLGTAAATFTIVDDDPTLPGQPQPVATGVRITPASVVVIEGGHTVQLELTRVGNTSAAMTMSCTVVAATASIPTDYLSFIAPIIWNAGDVSKKRIEYHLNGDAIAEPDETIVVRCSPRLGLLDLPVSEATITIVDDDGAGAFSHVSWGSPTASINENATSMTLQAVRVGHFARASSVDYYVTAGTASAADVVISSGTLTWNADDTAAKFVTITLLPDTIDEPDETFTVTLHNPSAGTVLVSQNDVATVTVHDDDSPTAGGGGSNGGGKGGGGGAEHPFILLLYACLSLLLVLLRSSSRHSRARHTTP